MQHSDNRLIMDSPSASKTIWSTTTSLTLFPASKNSSKPSTHDTGNRKEKFPMNPMFPSHLETSPNPSTIPPSQTTSLARILQWSRRTTLDPQGNTSTPKEMTSNLSTKLSKDGKLMPQEHQCQLNNNLCLFCGNSGHVAKDFSKASAAKACTAKAEQDKSTSSGSELKKD